MYSIKPGRTRSLFGAFAGVIFVIVLFVMMSGMGAAGAPRGMLLVPGLMALLVVVGVGIQIYNAFAADRASEYDITTQGEEFDPLDPASRRRRILRTRGRSARTADSPTDLSGIPPAFCTKCGKRLSDDDNFCGHCGMAVDA